MTWYKKHKYILIALLFSFLTITAFQLLFYADSPNAYAGDESYLHLRLIDSFQDTNSYLVDDLQDRTISYSLTLHVLSLLPMSNPIYYRFAFLLLSLLLVFLAYIIFKELDVDDKTRFYSLLLIIFNPIYLYTSTSINTVTLSMVFLLACFYFTLKKNSIFILLYVLALLSNFLLTVLFTPFLSYWIYNKGFKLYQNVLPYFFAGIYALTPLIKLSQLLTLHPDTFQDVLVYFNFSQGYSITFLALSIVGLVYMWRRDKKHALLYTYVFFLFTSSILYSDTRILAILLLSGFASKALLHLYEAKWEFIDLKYITLTFIVAGLLFSSLVFYDNEKSSPSPELIQAMQELESQTSGLILSVERNGHVLSYVANMPVFIDEHSYKYESYEDKKNFLNDVFSERRSNPVQELLRDAGIQYIVIDSTMLEGEVWNSEREGLLFVIRFSDDISVLIENEEVTVYSVDY